MKAKILLISCLLSLCAFAQVNNELSDAGKRHYKAAMTLFDMASTIEDYKSVANEFELVAVSDPNYADTYFNLGKIYTKLGKEYGAPYFQKARDAFNKYKELRPDEANTADDEIYAIDLVEKTSVTSRAEKKKELFVGRYKNTDMIEVCAWDENTNESLKWKYSLHYRYELKITNVDGKLKAQVSTDDGDVFYISDEKYDGKVFSFNLTQTHYWNHETSCRGCIDHTIIYSKWSCELSNDSNTPNLIIRINSRSECYIKTGVDSSRYKGKCYNDYTHSFVRQ